MGDLIGSGVVVLMGSNNVGMNGIQRENCDGTNTSYKHNLYFTESNHHREVQVLQTKSLSVSPGPLFNLSV
jgi:hypothetical protein